MTNGHDTPLGPPPARRPGSLRRTSSIQTHAFQSLTAPFEMLGSARDLYSADNSSAMTTLAEDTLKVGISADRLIRSVEAKRCNDQLSELVSLRLGGPMRKAMAQLVPDEVEQSTLLHRLLDDTVGASIVRNAALEAWGIDHRAQIANSSENAFDVTGSCISFTPGAQTVLPNGRPNSELVARISGDAPPHCNDPHAWHQWPILNGPNQLRLRRMDLWEEAGLLHVDAGFQDSAAYPDTQQSLVFHEYRLDAVIEPDTFVLQSVDVEPGILPFTECLQSTATAQHMVGQSLLDFRRSVPAQLPGIAGCTHLNDVLRSLQDVVSLTELLHQANRQS